MGRRRRAAPAADEHVDLGGRAVVPGFVDSHAHLVFAGDRAAEFAARMAGARVHRRRDPHAPSRPPAPRPTTQLAAERCAGWSARCCAQGTTTVEIKSGYGLTVADEARVAARSPRELTDETTYLGAHVVPPSTPTTATATSSWSPARCSTPARRTPAGSTCSATAAPSTRTRPARSCAPAMARGLLPRLHGNQLGHGPGVQLAVELGAASVDHCTHLDRRRRRRAGRVGDGRHAAARRGVLDPAAYPTRGGCSTPASRSRSPRTATRARRYTS